MAIPEFISFYGGYTVASALDEAARTFFALVNQMYRLKAGMRLAHITDSSISQSDSAEARTIIEDLQKQYSGADDMLRQADVVRSVNHG